MSSMRSTFLSVDGRCFKTALVPGFLKDFVSLYWKLPQAQRATGFFTVPLSHLVLSWSRAAINQASFLPHFNQSHIPPPHARSSLFPSPISSFGSFFLLGDCGNITLTQRNYKSYDRLIHCNYLADKF